MTSQFQHPCFALGFLHSEISFDQPVHSARMSLTFWISTWILAAVFAGAGAGAAVAQDEFIPRTQERPPGPPLSPAEAIAKMSVPEGFAVELVAAEPDIVNPVAMTFDERGRVWITESFEYPRRAPGVGRDRVKVLEDTNGDGRMDKVTVFAEGLNIPSGIAVGHGGVWVANSPDILFMQDTDGDDVADTREVVVTGFGRDDTHELPNSLTWGPDGWLYGLNGVFNRSVVEQNGKTFDFTCALFRIHPRTREFQIFAEGTSNPWGIAWNSRGSAFLSACVIDHLWHLTETGYYHRQGGPYPPFTWKLESIVDHKHQKAAYCGIHYFDSDAYPVEYRDRLYMGNIHGGCINVDRLEDNGSTYRGIGCPDFLTANDVWFMPVVQKTGPDGCLWVLDWYDRYHCYQDANHDPRGVDRLKGRLYRVRYKDTPHAKPFDLGEESDDQLIARLRSPNVFYRDIAQRLLVERASGESRPALQTVALNEVEKKKTRLHALWALIGAGNLDENFHLRLLNHSDADLREWAVRAAGNAGDQTSEVIAAKIASMSTDSEPRVRLQTAVTAAKVTAIPTMRVLVEVMAESGDDPVIPNIVWQNLYPLLESDTAGFLTAFESQPEEQRVVVSTLFPRVADRVLALRKPDAVVVGRLIGALLDSSEAASGPAIAGLRMLTDRAHSGELSDDALRSITHELEASLAKVGSVADAPIELKRAALEFSSAAGSKAAIEAAIAALATRPSSDDAEHRIRLLTSLLLNRNPEALSIGVRELTPAGVPSDAERQRGVLATLGRLPGNDVALALMTALPALAADVRPMVIEVLSTRVEWGKLMLERIADGKLAADTINANQARRLLAFDNPELTDLVLTHWGSVRTERDPLRDQLLMTMTTRLRQAHSTGNTTNGKAVFRKVCGQCHKIHGEGIEVGPDITRNGRASFQQLLSNLFDPSLVIGSAYQGMTVVTSEGRVLSGLLIEDSPQRIRLKVQGGREETIPRDEVDDFARSNLSLMPEGLERQLTEDELRDLFAYLSYDLSPENESANLIPGIDVLNRQTENREEYSEIVQTILPGFESRDSGVDGLALVQDYFGRPALRTHPVNKETPCRLSRQITVPEGSTRTLLRIHVAPHEAGDWELRVRIDNRTVLSRTIAPLEDKATWRAVDIDLTEFAGRTIRVDLENHANDWKWEFGYWGGVELLTEFPRDETADTQ